MSNSNWKSDHNRDSCAHHVLCCNCLVQNRVCLPTVEKSWSSHTFVSSTMCSIASWYLVFDSFAVFQQQQEDDRHVDSDYSCQIGGVWVNLCVCSWLHFGHSPVGRRELPLGSGQVPMAPSFSFHPPLHRSLPARPLPNVTVTWLMAPFTSLSPWEPFAQVSACLWKHLPGILAYMQALIMMPRPGISGTPCLSSLPA